jgi:hypothetical protein
MKNVAYVRPTGWDGGHLSTSFGFPAKPENPIDASNSPTVTVRTLPGIVKPLAETVKGHPEMFKALAETVRGHAEMFKTLAETVKAFAETVRGLPEMCKPLPVTAEVIKV